MMGPRKEAQAAQFYDFSLWENIPRDHLLRSIDRFVDRKGIRVHLEDYYCHTGRASVDPEQPMFETIVARCIKEGLVSGQHMAMDASLIEALGKK